MMYIGIDPGKKGSVTRIDPKGKITVVPTPLLDKDYHIGGMVDILKDFSVEYDERDFPKDDESFCIIERSQAMPGQGVVSMFEFGRGYGIWLGILETLEIPYQIIHSRTWTKQMLKGAPGEGKARAVSVASRLFPEWKPKLKKEWEYADSILLAEYGRRLKEKEE